MFLCSKRLGVFFASVAVIFATAVLPFHYHGKDSAAETTKSPQSHCPVCHLQTTARATTPIERVQFLHFLNERFTVNQVCFTDSSIFITSSASPRAPPASA